MPSKTFFLLAFTSRFLLSPTHRPNITLLTIFLVTKCHGLPVIVFGYVKPFTSLLRRCTPIVTFLFVLPLGSLSHLSTFYCHIIILLECPQFCVATTYSFGPFSSFFPSFPLLRFSGCDNKIRLLSLVFYIGQGLFLHFTPKISSFFFHSQQIENTFKIERH